MAKVDRSFHMDEGPARAQERFEQEIGWELHRDEGFVAVREVAGEIDYSDGRIDDESDEHALLSEQPVRGARGGGGGQNMAAYGALRELLARRIKVELTPDGSGTHVRIHGHAEGRLRDAIELLGTPGHWPELRWTEGVPTEEG